MGEGQRGNQEGEAEVARRRTRGAARRRSTSRGVPTLDPVEESWDSGDGEEESVEADEVEAEGVEGHAEQ